MSRMNKIIKVLWILSLLLMQSCFVYGEKAALSLVTTIKQKEVLSSTLTSVNVSNNQITINGRGFSKVTVVKIKGTSTDSDLSISSKSDSQIIATASSALSLLVGGTFDLIIGTAEAQATYAITFTLQDGAVTASKLAQMSASTGQVLKWNGSAWAPASLSSSQVYRGGWNATTNTSPTLSDSTVPASGEYYIVTTAGDQDLGSGTISFLVGDWVMSNGTTWDKITGSLSGAGTTNYFPFYSSSSTLGNSPMYLSGSNIGIGKTNPGSALDIKGTLRLSGSTSGYVGLAPAAAAGSITYTLPAADGTSGQVLSTNAAGVLSWQTIAVSGGTVTDVTSANADIGITAGTTIPVLTLNSGTAANQIVKLTSDSKLPAVDGSLVTALNPAALSAAVAVNKGGTGLTAGTSGGIPYFSSTSTIASTAAGIADEVFRIPSGGGAPAFGAIDISKSASVTGALAITNGGTGAATLGAAQSALGITVSGATTGTGAVVGTGGVQADKFCLADSSGGGISCTDATSSLLAGSISDESGTGALLFGTSPTISNPVVTGTLRLSGSSSGYVSFVPTAAAGSTTYMLPSTQGTSGQVLSTDGVATTPTLTWITPATTSTTLVGDIGGTIGANTIGTGKVTSTHILDGTILNADINASAAIDASKINTGVVSNAEFNYLDGVTSAIQTQLNGKATSTLADTNIFVGNGSNVATGVAVSGDATLANTGALTLNTVTVAKGGTGATTLGLNQLLFGNGTSAVGGLTTTATPSILLSAVTTGAPAWTTSTAGNFLQGSVTGVKFAAIALSDLPSGSLSGSGTSNYIPYYSAASTLANSPLLISGTSPTMAVDVAGSVHATGQIYSGQYNVATGAAVDFNNGNLQVLASVGQTDITLSNMKDGGSYVLVITDTTQRTYTFTNCTTSKFSPANASTTSGTMSTYNILKLTISGVVTCFISWSTGF